MKQSGKNQGILPCECKMQISTLFNKHIQANMVEAAKLEHTYLIGQTENELYATE